MAILQMTWQPSLLSHKRKSSPPVGLRNLGNTCYLNSVLQCLTYTPPLANFCLKSLHSSSCDSAPEKKSECPFCILEKRIARSLSLESALDSPAKINSCLKIFAQHFRNGRQEDAHEFLRYVIDACHNTCLRLKKLQQQRKKIGSAGGGDGSENTVVKEIFGGALQNQVKCLSCGAESNKVDEIMDISLDVLHSSSLKDALQKFFQPEILDGNNKYKCDKCNKLVAARKQMSILQAPNVLVIQLKRFEGIFGGKIDKPIAFEEVLVLSSYMCKASQDPHPEYKLFGTIVHSGFSPDSGHYYAYIKDAMGHWYCCNDSYVSHSSVQDVLSEKVYILFFSRAKQRPPSAKKCLPSNGLKNNESNGLKNNESNGLKNNESNRLKNNESNGLKNNESNGTSKSEVPKGHLAKPENMMQFSGHQSEINNSSSSKVDKVPGIFEKANIKKLRAAGNIKIVVHQRESGNKNGVERGLVHVKKEALSALDRSGFSKTNVNGKTTRPSSLANGNGKHTVTADTLEGGLCKENGCSKKETSDHKEVLNGNVESSTTNSSLKRKSQDSCILPSEDVHSSGKMEVLKKELIKEASSVLQSCGWTDNVYAFMQSKKRLRARGDSNGTSDYDEEKRLLISDAKATFISQIPESLKSSLIERLRSFHQEKT